MDALFLDRLKDLLVEDILDTSDAGIIAEEGHCPRCHRDGSINDADLANLKCRTCGWSEQPN